MSTIEVKIKANIWLNDESVNVASRLFCMRYSWSDKVDRILSLEVSMFWGTVMVHWWLCLPSSLVVWVPFLNLNNVLSILKILVSVERVLSGFLTFLQLTKWLHLPTLPNNNGLADRPCGRLLLILIYTLIKTMTKFSNVVGYHRPDLLWLWDIINRTGDSQSRSRILL